MKLRLENNNIITGIFTFMIVSLSIKNIINGELLFALSSYLIVGLLLTVSASILSKQKFEKKLIIAWLPALWIEEVYNWVYK